MPLHKCVGSDHVSKLAVDAGFRDWQSIWDVNGSLKSRRSNPNVLLKDRIHAGNTELDRSDSVMIPKSEDEGRSASTDADHPHVVRSNKLFLRIRVLKGDFTAVANAVYSLTIDGAPAPFNGKTDGQGQLEQEIPRVTQTGKLTVRVPPDPPAAGDPVTGPYPVTWALQIGALNPIMEHAPDKWCTSGVQQRLNNLGINAGVVDGITGPSTRGAITRFQTLFGLDTDGKAGQIQTQPKLKAVHDDPDSVLGPVPPPDPST